MGICKSNGTFSLRACRYVYNFVLDSKHLVEELVHNLQIMSAPYIMIK